MNDDEKHMSKCVYCQKQINLETVAQTYCSVCEKDFCFDTCFTEYHIKNNLNDGHSALCISNPSWTINMFSKKDEYER
jgi:hypothetical protein